MAEEDKSLNEFISYVGSLYEIVPPGRVTGFDVDFQKLKQLSVELKQCPDHVSNAGQIPENKKKNRYKDITPFDSSRVTLTCTNDEINSDYINASFIKGADGHRNYIASQGPLPHTVLDFWQMLWQYNINVIVMVCREIELGKKKCERYWADRGDSKRFGDITVTLSKKEDLKDGYCLRTIKAEKGNEIRYIKQFHYTSWPDHGVPKTCLEILSLINHVRDVQSYSQDETTPLCVHCSAGCGRTGAVLAVDYVRNLLECKKVPSGLRTFEIISEMRKQRPAIVQTKDQYEFVNMAISEMFRIYMQIRTVAYKEFNAGYQQEDYVNINISTSNAANKKKIDNRPTTLSYENIDVVRKQQQERGQKLYSPAENDIPPAKPSRPALGRPISQIVANNNTPKSTYSNFNDRKQSAPVVSFPVSPADKKEPPPAVSPKPRSNQNLLSSLDARSSSHPRLLSGSPVAGKDVGKSTPPTKPKAAMKPESAAKKVAVTSPPPKPPGKPEFPKHLHGKTVNDSSGTKSTFSFSSTNLPQNSGYKSPSSPHPEPPKKPPLLKLKSPKSPISDKVQQFEKQSNIAPVLALKPVPKKPNIVETETVLHITEENDIKNETDHKLNSPSKDRQKRPRNGKMPPPVVKPKPKVNAKLIIQELNSSQERKNKAFTKPSNPPMRSMKRTGLRPFSQIFEQSSKANEKMKVEKSSSVFDLTDIKKSRPIVPQKTTIVRSASVSGMDMQVPNSYENVSSHKNKPRTKLNSNDKDSNDVEVKVFSIQPRNYTQSDASYGAVIVATTKAEINNSSEPIQTKSFTQADQSYGAVIVATKNPESKDTSSSNQVRRESVNVRVATPKPFIKQNICLHRGTKITTAFDFEKDGGSTPTSVLSEHHTPVLPHNYENTVPSQTPSSHPTAPTVTNSTFNHDYVNTQFDSSETEGKHLPELSNTVINSTSQAPDKTLNDTSAHTPPIAPSQSSKPTKLETYGNTEMHGSVQSADFEGANAAMSPLNSKPIEEMKKRAPIKPQRSMRKNIPHAKNYVKDDHLSNNKQQTLPANFQKYQKKNIYNDVILAGDNNNETTQFIDDVGYGEIADVSVQRSNSNASVDSRSSPRHARTPPRLPARTAESQIALSESPPALPTRTADSYVTIEEIRRRRPGRLDDEEQQTYEAVEQSALTPANHRGSQPDTGRRPSANATSGTNILAAKAKGFMEKTSNAFSKVGATIGKGKEDDNGSPPSTMSNRKPSYVPTPMIHGGQDISFGKRLKKKVKGARNLK